MPARPAAAAEPGRSPRHCADEKKTTSLASIILEKSQENLRIPFPRKGSVRQDKRIYSWVMTGYFGSSEAPGSFKISGFTLARIVIN